MSKYKPILKESSNEYYINLIKTFYKFRDTNEPFIATQAQADIFAAIVNDNPAFKRIVLMGYSQFGKSEIVGMALLWRSCNVIYPNRSTKIVIITPTGEKSQIIMDYILTHIRDNKIFTKGLMNVESIDKLRVTTRKDKLVWSNNSEIRTLSANVKQKEAKSSGLMGFGGDIIVIDEATDIPDANIAKVLRMLAGKPEDSKLIKVFNPTERNHAYKSYLDPNYLKIVVDWEDGIAQGRMTQELIKELYTSMPESDFKVLYDCEFPESSDRYLLTEDQITSIGKESFPIEEKDPSFAGLDTAWKGNDDIILTIIKGKNFILQKSLKPDLWDQSTAERISQEILSECFLHKVKIICIDSTGNGALLYDTINRIAFEYRNTENKIIVLGINFAASPTQERIGSEDIIAQRSLNKRAEMYMDFRKAVLDQSIYIPEDFKLQKELALMEYGFQAGKYKMEDKELITKRIGHSPDKSDSAVLAYHGKILHKYYGPFEGMQYVY